jgi:catecholate siderophore receptor
VNNRFTDLLGELQTMHKKQLPVLAGFRCSALALAVAAVLPTTAYAQDVQELPTAKASAQDEDSYKVDQSTLNKYSQPLLDTAKTITVIPQSVMKDRNIDSLSDALRGVSGISLAAGEGGAPPGDSASIRGFSTSNNMMIDGVRDIAGYARDTYNTEAIEVSKGPGSAVSGRGSAGGSINMQSKTAKLEDFTDISLRVGSESDHRVQLDANKAISETSAIRVNLLTDAGDVAGRDEVENAKDAIALSFATGIGTDSRFNIGVDYQKQDNLPDYGIPWVANGSDPVAELADYVGGPPPVDFSNFYGNVYRDFEDITAQSITAKYEKDLSESTMLRVLGRVGSVERLSIVTAPRFLDSETSTDVRLSDEKTRSTENSLKVLQFDLVGQYQAGGITHDVVTGIELSEEKYESWLYDDDGTDNLDTTPGLVDLYNPDAYVAYSGNYVVGGQDDEATGDTTAFYIFDTLTFNPQWELSLGLRYDIFETTYFYDLSGSDPSVKADNENKELSWSTGLVYKPADNGSIYFGAGNSFTSSAEDLTVTVGTRSGNDAELDPEETVSYELGTKWDFFNGRLTSSAAIFRTEKTNALTDAADGFYDDDNGNYNTLDGVQRVDGLELSVGGQFTDQFSVTAAYTFQDSEVVNAGGDDAADEGNELAQTPKHSYSLWGRYDMTEKLAFGLGLQYVGERYNSTSTTGRETADDYTILDLMVSYQISDKWNVQLNAENLTDEEYVNQLGGGHFIPGSGRYASLTTSYSF